MVTPLSWLERVPTYKGQIAELGEGIDTFGFLGYPLLQTADIILYRATQVPVGQDQLPHLELAREVVRRMNHLYGPLFPEPQALLAEFPLVLGPDNRKMSKSYGNAVTLGMTDEEIDRLVMSMITDPQRVRRDIPGRPEVCNVFSWHRLFGASQAEIDAVYRGCTTAVLGCVEDKRDLAARVRASSRRSASAARPCWPSPSESTRSSTTAPTAPAPSPAPCWPRSRGRWGCDGRQAATGSPGGVMRVRSSWTGKSRDEMSAKAGEAATVAKSSDAG